MVDPDALRYLRIAQADLGQAQRMVELRAFATAAPVFGFNRPAKKPSKAGSTPREAWLPSPTTSSP